MLSPKGRYSALTSSKTSRKQAVVAANQAFYEAIVAHDLAQMDAVWAHEPYVRTIHPGNMHADAGWEAVRVGWQKLFERYPKIEVSSMPEPHLRVGDDVAWVTGEEPASPQLPGRVAGNVGAEALNLRNFEMSKLDNW